MDSYQEFIFYRTYSRWNGERRESWEEAVDRYMDYMKSKTNFSQKDYNEVRKAIINMEVMPSMRLLWSAGRAADKTNATAYNCSFVAPTKLDDFGEILYLLTCGCGVGFSCEKHVVDHLPKINKQTGEKLPTYHIADSREGWAKALVYGLKTWFEGKDVKFDYSHIRPAGARLKTMGGRASGPEPLMNLLDFVRETVFYRQGHKLRTIDVHDIVCKIGEVVVAGGVRRSSEISLSDLEDPDLKMAKTGAFWETEPQRTMSNNSAVFKDKPTQIVFLKEWMSLMQSGTGERGVFNRGGLEEQMPARRWEGVKDTIDFTGTNPCGEITLRSKQFCNLTEVVARADDTRKDLFRKMRIATILGTFQSSLTYFPYLSKDWKKNCEEERLLGVSITGQLDSPAAQKHLTLRKLKEYAIEVNREYAQKLKINPSKSITCVKPSGTVSQLVNASSGMHPRYARYYIRRVRISATDPLFHMLRDQGVPYHPEVGQGENAHTYVLEFPQKSPDEAILADQLSALDQLEYWKTVKENYTEHNPSCTIYVSEDEWIAVANWLWENWDIIGGLSFLPRTEHVYQLAPYEPVTKSHYDKLVKNFPKVDFSQLTSYEEQDNTFGSEQGCAAGVCEIA